MTGEVSTQIVPSDDELSSAIATLKSTHPELGIAKLLAKLKLEQPTYSVSEKRFRKTLALIQPTSAASNGNNANGDKDGRQDLVAETGFDPSVDWSIAPKIRVKMFKDGKGKGLVARDKILEGEALWSEDPWITTQSPQLYEYFQKGGMCSQCFNLFSSPPKFAVHCQHCGQATFCSRLCYDRREDSAAHPDLLCPGQNLASEPLWTIIRKQGWRDLECVAKMLAKWRSLREMGDEVEAKKVEERVWGGMARVNQITKETERREWPMVGEDRLAELHRAHTVLLSALNPSETDKSTNTKSFYKALRKRRKQGEPLTEEEKARWFSFESFCQLLGLAGLNQEDSGGLYAIHAHMNHDCEPNIRVRNLPKDFNLPDPPCDLATRAIEQRGTNRLTFVARRTIHPGEELTLPYVNYTLPRSARRERLREVYGFWCRCTRCRREEGKPEPDMPEHNHQHEHGPNCHHD